MLFLVNFLLLVVFGAQASEPPLFESLPDPVIQHEIMKKLDDIAFVRFARTSKRMHELAKDKLLKRGMLKQRNKFKEKLSKDGTKLDLRCWHLKGLYKGVFATEKFKNLQGLDLSNNQLQQLDRKIFHGLTNLKMLSFCGKQLKSENIKELKKALPHADIYK